MTNYIYKKIPERAFFYARNIKNSELPESNQRPFDTKGEKPLQSNALPTELSSVTTLSFINQTNSLYPFLNHIICQNFS